MRISTGERASTLVDESKSKILLGRKLSDAELGCALAHRSAIRLAHHVLSNDHRIQWVLIVEDDAESNEANYELIAKELLSSSLNVPSIVSYFHGNTISHCSERESSIKRSRSWPTGTVCYAINRPGTNELSQFLEFPVNYVADWPRFFLRLDIYHSTKIQIVEA